MDNQTLRLLHRYRASNLALTANIRARLDASLTSRWRSMGSWRDGDMDRFLADVLPIVGAAERAMVDATASYVASVEAASSGSAFRPARVDYREVTGYALRGVDPREVFLRPQATLNGSLARGRSLQAAAADGERRLRSIGATNTQLAKTHTVAKGGKSAFYRRVLTGAENCALCVIASTQRYTRGNLAPIHPGCDCGVEPLLDEMPPHVIDPELLELTHDEIARKLGVTDRSGRDLGLDSEYADFTSLTVVRRHGELGPTLAWRGEHFAGPKSLGKAQPPQRSKTETEIARWGALQRTSERSIRILEDAKRAGTNMVDLVQNEWSQPTAVRDLDAAIAYHRSMIDRSVEELARLRG